MYISKRRLDEAFPCSPVTVGINNGLIMRSLLNEHTSNINITHVHTASHQIIQYTTMTVSGIRGLVLTTDHVV